MKYAIAAPFRLIAIVMIVTGAAMLYAVWYVEEKAERLPVGLGLRLGGKAFFGPLVLPSITMLPKLRAPWTSER